MSLDRGFGHRPATSSGCPENGSLRGFQRIESGICAPSGGERPPDPSGGGDVRSDGFRDRRTWRRGPEPTVSVGRGTHKMATPTRRKIPLDRGYRGEADYGDFFYSEDDVENEDQDAGAILNPSSSRKPRSVVNVVDRHRDFAHRPTGLGHGKGRRVVYDSDSSVNDSIGGSDSDRDFDYESRSKGQSRTHGRRKFRTEDACNALHGRRLGETPNNQHGGGQGHRRHGKDSDVSSDDECGVRACSPVEHTSKKLTERHRAHHGRSKHKRKSSKIKQGCGKTHGDYLSDRTREKPENRRDRRYGHHSRATSSSGERSDCKAVPDDPVTDYDRKKSHRRHKRHHGRHDRDRETGPKNELKRDTVETDKERRCTLPTLKLGSFDGTTCLDTFLAKFRNISEYYSWSERDQLFHLRAALDGRAGHTLWQMDRHGTVTDLIRLLRTRFGTEGQTERYRIELKGRRRRKNETLQSLYNDICRLISLSYPGQTGSLCDIVARDCFLQALDPELRMKIMERDSEPTTVEEALRVACRLEAIRRTADDERVEEVKQREKNIRAVEAKTTNEKTEKNEQKIKELENTVSEYKTELEKMRTLNQQLQSRVAEFEKVQNSNSQPGTTGYSFEPQFQPELAARWSAHPGGFQQPNQWRGGGPGYGGQGRFPASRGSWTRGRGRGQLSRDTCRRCGEIGHWERDCVHSPVTDSPSGGAGVMTSNVVTEGKKFESYVEVYLCGKKTFCLLDTGCDRNVLPVRLVNQTD